MKKARVGISLRSALAVGFTVVLCLMAFIVVVAFMRMESINGRLEYIVKNNVEKIGFAHSMETTLRERAIVMHTIAALSDPFQKDEYWQRFNELGNRFVISRDALLSVPLSKDETVILSQIRELTSETQPFVVSVVDKALEARTSTDTITLLESIRSDAVPRQMLIAGLLENLVVAQKNEMDSVVSEANEEYYRAVYFMSTSASLALLIGLAVAWVSIQNATKAADVLHQMAMFDNLTKLPNRVLFHDRIAQAIATSRRDHRNFAIISVDLNGFKDVNDTLGHQQGDRLLALVAARFLKHTRDSDTVARFGGDEFLILTHGTDRAGAEILARNVASMFLEPFSLSGHHVSVGASIGIAVYPEHGQEIELLLQRADAAMYVAKRARTGFEFYDEERSETH